MKQNGTRNLNIVFHFLNNIITSVYILFNKHKTFATFVDVLSYIPLMCDVNKICVW